MSSATTKYQKFEMRTIKRSRIKMAAYNPRVISEGAQKRLRKKIRQVGLLTPVVWNKRTKNLVSGHQRLEQIDFLEKYPGKTKDYDVLVAVVDLDEKTEKEMNVFFNNPGAQGEWDLDALADLNLESGIDFKDMGFSEADVDFLFDGDGRFSELFKDVEEVGKAKDTLKDIKKDRKKATEKLKKEDGADFYFVVVCESQDEKDRVLRLIGSPIYEKYINSVMIENAVAKAKR